MLIYAIDDEPNMLYLLHEAIAEAAPEAEILDFLLGTEALARMEKGDAIPDVVFSDIQMPGVSGLELAARMISIHPLQIVFFKNLVLTDFGFWLYYNCSKISASSKS